MGGRARCSNLVVHFTCTVGLQERERLLFSCCTVMRILGTQRLFLTISIVT
jgi:hypothetical protein